MPQLAVFVAIFLLTFAVAHLKTRLDHYLLISISIIWHMKKICISYCSVFSVRATIRAGRYEKKKKKWPN